LRQLPFSTELSKAVSDSFQLYHKDGISMGIASKTKMALQAEDVDQASAPD